MNELEWYKELLALGLIAAMIPFMWIYAHQNIIGFETL